MEGNNGGDDVLITDKGYIDTRTVERTVFYAKKFSYFDESRLYEKKKNTLPAEWSEFACLHLNDTVTDLDECVYACVCVCVGKLEEKVVLVLYKIAKKKRHHDRLSSRLSKRRCIRNCSHTFSFDRWVNRIVN